MTTTDTSALREAAEKAHPLVRTMAGEERAGMRVAGWRWKTPVLDTWAWSFASHWSTGPDDAERLFSDDDVLNLLSERDALAERVEELTELLRDLVMLDGEERATGGGPGFKGRHEKAWTLARQEFEP